MRSTIASAGLAVLLAVAAPAAGAADWPMFHVDAFHTGVSPDTGITATNAPTLSLLWQANTGASTYSSPAVAFDSQLHRQVVYIGNQAGTMTAYDAATGARIWALDLAAQIASSPSVVGGVVYFGSHDHWFYAVDGATGTVKCRFHTGGVNTSSPAVVKVSGVGLVAFFGDNGLSGNDDGGHMWAVNAVDPNAAADCSQLWSYSGWGATPGTVPMAGSWSPPAFTVDTTGRQLVIFGSSSPDNAAYALDATTGERVWRFSPGATYRDADVGAGPTISPPGVNGFADGVAYIIGKNRVVHARNLRTGAAIWQRAIDPIAPRAGGATRSTAALLGNQLVTGYGAGLIALDATTGALIWTTQQGGLTTPEIVSSPAITGPPLDLVVFAQDTGGTLRGFALADGAQRWSAKLGGLGYSSPAVAGDRVFVGAGNGFLYAFGEGTGASARPNTNISSPANGAVVPNPTGDLVISGAATDDTSVHRVLVAITDTNAGTWWDPATSRWVSVFTQWDATLSQPDTASTRWTATYPVPRTGGQYVAQAEAVDADGQHDPTIPTASYTVTSLGKPPDTAITSPANLQRFPFPRNPDGTVRHQPFKITIRGSAVDSGGAHPGIQRVIVQVMNREHGEYWCGPGGCPGLPSGTFWRPQPATVVAGLAAPGASSTNWTSSFMTYDHPHTYMITAWAVDRDGERDITSATVPMICVREPADRSCHG